MRRLILLLAVFSLIPRLGYGIGADYCTGLPVISSLPYSDFSSINSFNNDITICGSSSRDAFYSLVLPNSGWVRASVCGANFNSAMAVRTGGACPGSTEVQCQSGNCSSDDAEIVFQATADTTYYIIVDATGILDLFDGFTLNVTSASASDACPGEQILVLPFTVAGTVQNTANYETNTCATGVSPEVFYHYTPTNLVLLSAKVISSEHEAVAVRRGACDPDSFLLCDNGLFLDSSVVEFWAEPGITYHFIIDVLSPDGNYTFSLEVLWSDQCPGASISSLPFVDTASMAGATHNYSGPCATGGSPEVVYSFTATDSAIMYATVSATLVNHAISVMRGNCVSGPQVICDTGLGTDTSKVTFLAEPDSTYYFIVEINSGSANYTFTLTQTTAGSDLCPGIPITILPFVGIGSMAGVTHNYSGPCAPGPFPEVVYSFTATDLAVMYATVSTPSLSHAVRVKSGNCVSGPQVICDTGFGTNASEVAFLVEPDSTYYFIVEINSFSANYTFTLEELPPPANDVCPGTPIPSLPYTESASILGALHNYSGPCATGTSPDIVYSYTPTDSALLVATVSASPLVNHAVSVYRGMCAVGTNLTCGNGVGSTASAVVFWAEPDSTYYFDVEVNSFTSNYTFNLQQIPPVANDVCPGTPIPSLPYMANASIVGAFHDYTGPCATGTSPDVVYSYTATDSARLYATLSTSLNVTHAVSVYRGACASGTQLLCDTGVAGIDPSTVLFWAEPDSTYYFIVEISSGSANYTFTLEERVANDICPGTSITSLPFIETASIAGATHNYSGPCATGTSPEVVYSYTATDSLELNATVNMSASINHALSVHRGTCASNPPLLCDNDFGTSPSVVTFWAEPDSTYYFVVEINTFNADYTFTLQEAPPQNDNCPGTEILALPYQDNASTLLATDLDAVCGSALGRDVIYYYTAAESALVVATVVAGWSDVLGIGRNECISDFDVILCDDGIGADSSRIEFWTEPDSTYSFVVDGLDTAAYGDYAFSLIVLSCPNPDSLVIQKSGNDAILTWPHVSCDTPLYSIYRTNSYPAVAGSANLIDTTSDSTYTDVGILLSGGAQKFYIVTAH